MPCVPGAGPQAGVVLQLESRERRPVRLQFLAASAGILVSFWALALMSTLLRATQGAVGWGIQFQSVWFIGFMVVVTALFCANLLGLFEMRLPSNLSTRLPPAAARPGGTSCRAALPPCWPPLLRAASSALRVAFALGRRSVNSGSSSPPWEWA